MIGNHPPNNPLKLPVFAIITSVGFVLIAFGALNRGWAFTVAGVILCVVGVLSILVIRQGRNPWWIRTPLDRWWQQQQRRSD